MAKRSATECAGILDLCNQLDLVEETRHLKGRELLLRIVAMLTKMAQTCSNANERLPVWPHEYNGFSGSGTHTGSGSYLYPPYPVNRYLYLDFANFWTKIRERGKPQRNEFRRKGLFPPSWEIHLAGERLSPKMSSKICKVEIIRYILFLEANKQSGTINRIRTIFFIRILAFLLHVFA